MASRRINPKDIKVNGFYDISFELEAQEVDENGDLGPPHMILERWQNAQVIAILENGNLILRRPTGIKHTLPRLEEIQAWTLNQYEFSEIETPDGA